MVARPLGYSGGALVMAVLMTITLISCFYPKSAQDLIGEYLAKYPDGSESLTLAADGTFQQEMRVKGTAGTSIFGTEPTPMIPV